MQLSPLQSIETWGAPTLEGFDLNNVQEGRPLSGKPGNQYVRFYKKEVSEIHADKVKINEKTGDTKVLSTKSVPVMREFVEIVTPGDKNRIDTRAEEYHKRTYFSHYQAFRDGKSAPQGEPVDGCTFIPTHVATELQIHKCFTVEQLSEASDMLCQVVPNGFELREFARAHVKANMPDKSSKKIEALEAQIAHLHTLLSQDGKPMVRELPEAKAIETVIEAPKKKGRPAKQITEVTE